MKNIIEPPLDDFISVLQKSKALLLLMNEIKDFSMTVLINLETPDKEIVSKIQESIKLSSINMLILSGTLLLYTVGQFENYIKETMKIVGEVYASKCTSFDYIPVKMQAHLVYQTAEIVQKPTKYGFQKSDVKILINQLASSMNSNGTVPINKESLVITEQNMRSDILSELLNRFEIKEIWRDLSKQTSIKSFFVSENEQEIEKLLKETLNKIMDDRNGIAHPSSNPSFPDYDTINKYIDYLEMFAKEFTSIMIIKCSVYTPTQNCTY